MENKVNVVRLDLEVAPDKVATMPPLLITDQIQESLKQAGVPWGRSVRTHEWLGNRIRFRIERNGPGDGINDAELLTIKRQLLRDVVSGYSVTHWDISYGEDRGARDI